METPTQHWVETITGLAATGVELIIALIGERPMQTHPFVPVLQITTDPTVMNEFTTDLDHLLDGDHAGWAAQILEWSRQTMEGVHIPKMYKLGISTSSLHAVCWEFPCDHANIYEKGNGLHSRSLFVFISFIAPISIAKK